MAGVEKASLYTSTEWLSTYRPLWPIVNFLSLKETIATVVAVDKVVWPERADTMS